MIKVLLVDDHQMFLEGIESILTQQDDIEVLGEANEGGAALRFLEKNDVDVVLMDISMPNGMDGITATKRIKENFPNVKILILSMHSDATRALELMKIGAHGYILKDKSKGTLVHGIKSVYAGLPYYGLDIMQVVTNQPSATEQENPLDQLSTREIEILTEIGEGYTSKEVAEKLHISTHTVNTHRRNLLHKLEVPNDKYLVKIAIKHGLVKL